MASSGGSLGGPSKPGDGYHFDEESTPIGHTAINWQESMLAAAQKLSEHEGRIIGIGSAQTASQSSLNLLQAVTLGVLALVVTVMVFGFGIVIARGDRVEDKHEAVSTRVTNVEVRTERIDATTQRLATDTADIKRDLSTLVASRVAAEN